MGKNESAWKAFHHQLYQVYHATIAASLIPFALLFLEWDARDSQGIFDGWSFYLLAQLMWLVVYGSWYTWKGAAVAYAISKDADLEEKLLEFKRRNVRKYILLMLMGLLSAGLLWVAPSFIFVLAYFAVLIQYSLLRPSEDKFVRDMGLTKNERNALHQ